MNFSKFNEELYVKEKANQLCRMVAGYAWPWVSQKDKTKTDIEIQGVKKQWNHTTEGWMHTPTAIDEVGCIHSIQGYDLNYAFVILGNDISYDEYTHKVVIHKERYFDKYGKQTAGVTDLQQYIFNVYYVLMTRGIKGTYVYVCDEALRNYMAQHMEVVK